ncbi:MAG: hypothetical protein R3F55_21360 [Alphaproteobacteria bacterium]
MLASDLVGWLAAALTLVAFSMQAMVPLRIAALAANFCFIVYGTLSGLYPVVALHAVLVPCNLYRLHQRLRASKPAAERREPRLPPLAPSPATSSTLREARSSGSVAPAPTVHRQAA